MDKERFEIHVCCLWKGGPNMEKFRNIGVKVHNFAIKRKTYFRVIREIRRYMIENEIDILQTTLFPSNFYGRIAALQAKVPGIISRYISIGEHKGKLLYWVYVIAQSILDWKSSKIVALSNAVKEYLIKRHWLSEDKIVVIHNGVDPEKFDVSVDRRQYRLKLGLNPDILTICCVARLEPIKGINYLVEAAKKVIDRGHNVQFLLVGGGSMRNSLQQLAQQMGIDDKVIFAGFRADIPEILNVSDVFVMPSLSEGLCFAIIEAMAASKPVIATRVGGIPDVISNEEVGMLVHPKNSDAIASALERMLPDEKLRREMGEKARMHIRDNFSNEAMVLKYQHLYEQFCDKKNSK
ncbi:MAG: glycosyltransferase family 4 protein [Sedimentisphaerales bacterium]|nr:glycosyltransferase family 4 protein [Sedimentisphaerales bacterium]